MTLATAEPDLLFAAKGSARPAIPHAPRAEQPVSYPSPLRNDLPRRSDAPDPASEQKSATDNSDSADGGLAPATSLASSHITRSPKATALPASRATAATATDDVESSATEPTKEQSLERRHKLFAVAIAVLGLAIVLLMVWYSHRESPIGAFSQTQSGRGAATGQSLAPSQSSRLTVARIASGSGDYLPSETPSALLSGASSDRAGGPGGPDQ